MSRRFCNRLTLYGRSGSRKLNGRRPQIVAIQGVLYFVLLCRADRMQHDRELYAGSVCTTAGLNTGWAQIGIRRELKTNNLRKAELETVAAGQIYGVLAGLAEAVFRPHE
jgi:hypothetical protein